ncbi:MAG: type II methionyl aminopeptidase [Nanoarchaeota archaeon]|nr:type II methionyl aminopeptidase [Nanoarchaeota archaeon]
MVKLTEGEYTEVEEDLDDWIEAGEIAAQCRELGRKMIKPDVKLLDVANAVEDKIKEKGGFPAFPVNISMNEIAAHYTPSRTDESVFSDQLVKIDVGVHINGAIGDTACTVDLSGKWGELVQASRGALDAAIKIVKDGTTLGEVGTVIQDTIKAKGFVPIANLSGHSLERFSLHAGMNIPNIATGDETPLEDGDIIAIEPFATNGRGLIKESSNPEIFKLVKATGVRSPIARNVLKEIKMFNELPFAKRWIQTKGAEFGIREMMRANLLKEYTPLPEIDDGMISQAEHTVYVEKKGCMILTELEE